MATAGVSWVRDVRTVGPKIGINHIIICELYANYPFEELQSNWGKISKGFLGEDSRRSLGKRFNYLFPDFRPYVLEQGKYKNENPATDTGLGYVIGHRGRCTVLNGEVQRFKHKVWRPLYQLVTRTISEDRPINLEERDDALESIILETVKGLPGVYINSSDDIPEEGYIGQSRDLAQRHKGHVNSFYRIKRAYITAHPAVAQALEKSIFDALYRDNLVARTRLRGGPKESRGAIVLKSPIVDTVDLIVKTHYSKLCRATVGF